MKLIALSTASFIAYMYLCELPLSFGQQTQSKTNGKQVVLGDPWGQMQRDWEKKKAAVDWSKIDGKSAASKQATMLVAAVKSGRLSAGDSDLIKTLGKVTDDDFRYAGAQALIVTFTENGTRTSLVDVLANWCPRRVFFSDVEFWLAFQTRNTMKDGVAVLWEAYDKSHNATAKKEIADALRRGFLAFGIVDSHDDEIVNKCRAWYKTHRAGLSPSIEYGDNIMHPRGNPGVRDPYATNGLFIPADRSKKRGD